MTRKIQKELEGIYLKKLDSLIGNKWEITEHETPDFIVIENGKEIGIELTEVFIDNMEKKGSALKIIESINGKSIKWISDQYYMMGGSSIKVDFMGIKNIHPVKEKILKKLLQRKEKVIWDQFCIDVEDVGQLRVMDLPREAGNYKIWRSISDTCGLVGTITEGIIQRAVNKKSTMLLKYPENLFKKYLVLVANRVYNSGRLQFDEEIQIDGKGFDKVYFLIYPFDVIDVKFKFA
jgi:hypothetical protein